MIRNSKLLNQQQKKFMQEEKTDFLRNLRLVEALYQEARTLGIFPLKNPLEGLDDKIRLAKRLNGKRTP